MKIPPNAVFEIELLDGKKLEFDPVDVSLQLATALSGTVSDDDGLRRAIAFWKERIGPENKISSTQAFAIVKQFEYFAEEVKKNVLGLPLPKSPEPTASYPPIPATA